MLCPLGLLIRRQEMQKTEPMSASGILGDTVCVFSCQVGTKYASQAVQKDSARKKQKHLAPKMPWSRGTTASKAGAGWHCPTLGSVGLGRRLQQAGSEALSWALLLIRQHWVTTRGRADGCPVDEPQPRLNLSKPAPSTGFIDSSIDNARA